MAEFDPDRNVYKVSDVKFTAEGAEYPVSGIRLSCVDNGIPTATVTLSPFSDDATKADLAPMIDKYNTLNALSGGRKSATLTATLKSESDTQEIKLEGWALLYAGLRDMSADGSFQVYVVMQHPIVRANLSAMCLQNLYNNQAGVSSAMDGATNLLEAVFAAIDDYLVARDPGSGSGPIGGANVDYSDNLEGTTREVDAASYGVAVAALGFVRTQLKWDVAGSGFACQSQIDIIAEHIKEYLGRAVSAEGQSILEAVRSTLGAFMLCVKPKFDSEKIAVTAFEPWVKPTLTIYDDQTSSIDIPPVTDAPVSGVMVVGPTLRITDTTTFTADAPDPASDDQGEYGKIDQGVIGGYTDLAKALGGDVRQVALPEWLSIYYENSLKGTPVYTRTGLNGEPTSPSSPDALAAYNETRETMQPAVKAHAHDMFWQMFRAQVGISLGLRFMMTSEGGPLVPGVCATLKTRSGGELFQFYITSVEHTLDAMAGTASSRVEGAYLRGKAASGGGAEAVGGLVNGIKSQMWS